MNTNNTRIIQEQTLPSPSELLYAFPLTETQSNYIYQHRQELAAILDGNDARPFMVVGPCSIHDPKAAFEYAEKLKALSDKVSDKIMLIMRVYFEKPRTTVGWKGLINDPFLDDSCNIHHGLVLARTIMRQIVDMGLPIGTEALDPITPQYLGDLVTWNAIGARTTESQTHREMASGLSSPVGFKNGTDGSIDTAIHAMLSAKSPHTFLGIDDDGRVAVIETAGNAYGHVILRGGSNGPNYDRINVQKTLDALKKHQLPENIVIDCSHGNSRKKYNLQSLVFDDVIQQIVEHHDIKGLMLESHLVEGQQSLSDNMTYGQSITDGCIGFDETEQLILDAYHRL